MVKKSLRKIILFDIDHTLLNTTQLKSFFEKNLSRLLKLPTDELRGLNKEFYKELKSSIEFSPHRYIHFLRERLSQRFPEAELMDLFLKSELGFRDSLYPETISVIEKLKGKHLLGIFSEGDNEFQWTKLKRSGIIDFFDPRLIFIYPNKSGKAELLVKKLGEVYIVDDNLQHILSLRRIKDVFPIWINRRADSFDNSIVEPIYSLKEIHQKLL